MAALGSSPTPITRELFRVVINAAEGAPEGAFPEPLVPIAPDPLTPEVSTPVKLETVSDEVTLPERVAVTVTLLKRCDAKARQISAVPPCTLVLATSTHVRPAP